ncbi:MAG: hypothetical protein ABIR47_03165 [Candidatus Kapaibacterium sp.]
MAFSPLIAVIVGIGLFLSPIGYNDMAMKWIWVAQAAILLVSLVSYILAVRRGMPRSVPIVLSLVVAAMCDLVIGLFMVMASGLSRGLFG